MTEAEWNASTDARAMLAWVTGGNARPPVGTLPGDRRVSSARKLRRLAIELYRRGYNGQIDRPDSMPRLIELAERMADDGLDNAATVSAGRSLPYGINPGWICILDDAVSAVFAACEVYKVGGAIAVALLRDIVGDPFHVLPIWRNTHRPGMGSMTDYLTDWVTPIVLSLARGAYDEPRNDGTLDPERLLILSDALEEAGCDNEILLRHLRGQEEWSNHVRGCWAVDLLLGKE